MIVVVQIASGRGCSSVASNRTAYVLRDHGLVYCPVTRAAHSSIKDAFLKSLGRPFSHRHANFPNAFWTYTDDVPRYRLPSVGIVREPVDRFLSAYQRLVWKALRDRRKPISLDKCIEIYSAQIDPEDDQFRPQFMQLSPVRDIWPFELLDEWWEYVRGISAIPLPDLQHRNPTQGEKPVPTDDQKEAIQSIYPYDVELYQDALRLHEVPTRRTRHRLRVAKTQIDDSGGAESSEHVDSNSDTT